MGRDQSAEEGVSKVTRAMKASSGDVLGHIVWSDVELAGHLVDRRVVRDALAAASLPREIQAESKSTEWAFGRAVSAWKSQTRTHFGLRREEKRAARVLFTNDTGEGLAMVQRAVAIAWPAATRMETQLRDDLDTSTRALVDADIARMHKLVDRFAHYMDAAEFQATIRAAMLDWFGGTRLRRHGSVYWIPAKASGELHRLIGVVEQVGRCVLPALPVTDANNARDSLARPLASAFERELHDLMREMRDLATSKKETRGTTWIARRDQLATIRGRVEVANEILQQRSTTLDGLMRSIESCAQRAIAADFKWVGDFDAIIPAEDPIGDFDAEK